ncbi:hypothetical protein ACQZV8_19155 [Magnetococcales bacterium HHB-1]
MSVADELGLKEEGWAGKLEYWFVQYNPLFFFSAFCMLSGIFVVTQTLHGLPTEKLIFGQVLLFGVIQAYELLLVAGAWFLFRTINQPRPGVILGLMALFFLFDGTFRIEDLAHMDDVGIMLTVGWVVLTMIKWLLLVRVFQLDVPNEVTLSVLAAAVGIAALPRIMAIPGADMPLLFMGANLFGGALMGQFIYRSYAIGCQRELSEWGETVLRRSVRAAWGILGGFYFYHLWNYIIWLGPDNGMVMIIQATPFAALFIPMAKEKGAYWSTLIGATFLATLYPPLFSWIVWMLAAAVAIRFGKRKETNLSVTYIVLVLVGFQGWGWQVNEAFPDPILWANISAIIALLAIAWRLRSIFSLIAAFGILNFSMNWMALMPDTEAGMGVLWIIISFLMLIAAITSSAIMLESIPKPGSRNG